MFIIVITKHCQTSSKSVFALLIFEFPSTYLCTNTWYYCQSSGCKVNLTGRDILICLSLITKEAEHLLHVPYFQKEYLLYSETCLFTSSWCPLMNRSTEFLKDFILESSFKFTVNLSGSYKDLPHTDSLPHYQHHTPAWYTCYNR